MAFRLLATQPLGWVNNLYATNNVAMGSTWIAISGASGATSSGSGTGNVFG